MNWPKVHAEARYARGRREEESGFVAQRGDNRPPREKADYSYDEKKLMKEAEKIVAGYTGNDGNLRYFKSDALARGTNAIRTPDMALKVFRILDGTEYTTGKKEKCRRPAQKRAAAAARKWSAACSAAHRGKGLTEHGGCTLIQHINDGTLVPEMARWLDRYTGTDEWITEIADRAAVGIAPMPKGLRRLGEVQIVASAEGGWQTVT
jgi:hypothetical protein